MDNSLFEDLPCSPPSSLEQVFAAADEQLQSLAKSVAALSSAVKSLKKSLQIGDVKQLQRSVGKLRSDVNDASVAIDGLGKALLTDFDSVLRSGAFVAEVALSARKDGLGGVRVVHGRILSFPVVVNVAPGDMAIRIGKKTMPMLRPTAVVEHLAMRRKRKPPIGAKKLLEAVAWAYQHISGDRQIAVKIQDIHEALTRIPGQSKEYPLLEFVTDLYLLERSHQTTIGGKTLSFTASTMLRGDSGIRIVGEEGEERVYSSLRFD